MLLYDLEQAPQERQVILQALKLRRPIPKKFREAPTIFFGLQIFYDAFWDLISDRPAQGAPIPWAPVQHWAQVHGLDGEATESLHYFVRKLDVALLQFQRRKSPKPST